MIGRRDAQFVISEIRFREYYKSRVESLNNQIDELEGKIAELTMPSSPNGRISYGSRQIGDDGSAFSRTESQILGIITKQSELGQEARTFEYRYLKAERYLGQLADDLDALFVKDFFAGMKYKDLEEKYHISNAYDRMIRIIQNNVVRV